MSETRKLHVKSYGCQMNAYDSQRMADLLIREGFVETAVAEAALTSAEHTPVRITSDSERLHTAHAGDTDAARSFPTSRHSGLAILKKKN